MSNTGGGCTKRLRSIHPWSYAKPSWTQSWETCPCRPFLSSWDGTGRSQEVPSNLRFSASVTAKPAAIQSFAPDLCWADSPSPAAGSQEERRRSTDIQTGRFQTHQITAHTRTPKPQTILQLNSEISRPAGKPQAERQTASERATGRSSPAERSPPGSQPRVPPPAQGQQHPCTREGKRWAEGTPSTPEPLHPGARQPAEPLAGHPLCTAPQKQLPG